MTRYQGRPTPGPRPKTSQTALNSKMETPGPTTTASRVGPAREAGIMPVRDAARGGWGHRQQARPGEQPPGHRRGAPGAGPRRPPVGFRSVLGRAADRRPCSAAKVGDVLLGEILDHVHRDHDLHRRPGGASGRVAEMTISETILPHHWQPLAHHWHTTGTPDCHPPPDVTGTPSEAAGSGRRGDASAR